MGDRGIPLKGDFNPVIGHTNSVGWPYMKEDGPTLGRESLWAADL